MTDPIARFVDVADLKAAYEGSYYFITGAGDPLEEWVSGYNGMLAEQNIGTPTEWLQTNGATVNNFAAQHYNSVIAYNDQFPGDLRCLLFPLDGLNVGRLPLFKIAMQDRWFDDVIQNMRVATR